MRKSALLGLVACLGLGLTGLVGSGCSSPTSNVQAVKKCKSSQTTEHVPKKVTMISLNGNKCF